MQNFQNSFHVARVANANFFAAELFSESFGADFPIPREGCGLSIPTPPEHWSQYVAFYRWDSSRIEVVGFCNWIRYHTVYLEGGLCVKRDFYLRLPREHWTSCRQSGGVAQLMMEAAAVELDDCDAWFGFCGDKKSAIVTARVGFVQTDHKHLIVKWFKKLKMEEQAQRIADIASIGPF